MFWYRRPLFLWPVACSSQKCWGTFVFYMGQAPILLNKPAMMVLFHLLCIKCRLFQPCRIEYSAFSLILRSKLMIIMVGRCLSMLSAILLNIHHILQLAQFQRIFPYDISIKLDSEIWTDESNSWCVMVLWPSQW